MLLQQEAASYLCLPCFNPELAYCLLRHYELLSLFVGFLSSKFDFRDSGFCFLFQHFMLRLYGCYRDAESIGALTMAPRREEEYPDDDRSQSDANGEGYRSAAMQIVDKPSATRHGRPYCRLRCLLAGIVPGLIRSLGEYLRRGFSIGHPDRRRLARCDTAAPASAEIAPGRQSVKERKSVRAHLVD